MRALTTAAGMISQPTAPTTMLSTHEIQTRHVGNGLKGKGTHRSWPQLPEELVRHIATYYLWIRAASTDVPLTWEARELWHQRILFTTVGDAFALERTLMAVCPQWARALESHFFWQRAVTLIDPTDSLAHLSIVVPPPQDLARSSAAQLRPYRLSPFRHFRQILNGCCFVCRINQPATTRGLVAARRSIASILTEHMDHFPYITLCRDHDHRRMSFCGVCLRESPMYHSTAALYGGAPPAVVDQIGIVENEDEETFPAVEATCRSCRHEWLWKKASLNPRDQEAIGGNEMTSDDWETRQLVDGFIEMAEGTITDVINLAREKFWLRRFTRLGDMMQQAIAAAKFNSSASAAAAYTMRNVSVTSGVRSLDGGGGDYSVGTWDEEEEEQEEEDEEDEEENTELMQLEEGGVKDLALGDWARTRILDGFWISPADIWYQHVNPGNPHDMPAVHPCPWTIDSHTSSHLSPSSSTSITHSPTEPSTPPLPPPPPPPQQQQHPSPNIVNAEIPPSFTLCEQAFIAHGQQLRLILLPPMKNIVRRIAIECAVADHHNTHNNFNNQNNQNIGPEDPTIKISRMRLEEVLRVLREEEGVWFDGYDWVERRRNDEEARRIREREREREERERGREEDDHEQEQGQGDDQHRSRRRRSGTSRSEDSEEGGGGDGGGEGSNSSSVGSNTTSPVLSTTTLQTTPSPPPLGDEGDSSRRKDESSSALRSEADGSREGARGGESGWESTADVIQNKVMIPVEPVLNPPRILRSIPYVPITTAHLPQFSLEAFKSVWREACAPLYHCRCRICERAVAAANATAASTTTTTATTGSVTSSVASPVTQYRAPPPHTATIPKQPYYQQQQQQQYQHDSSPIVLQQPYQPYDPKYSVIQQAQQYATPPPTTTTVQRGKEPVQIQLSEVEFVEDQGVEEVGEVEVEVEEEYLTSEYEDEEVEEEEVEEEEGEAEEGSESFTTSRSISASEASPVEAEEEQQKGKMSLPKVSVPSLSSSTTTPVPGRTRKRSLDEVEDLGEGIQDGRSDSSSSKRQRKIFQPPMMTTTATARVASPTTTMEAGMNEGESEAVKARMQRKRSSEELDDDDNEGGDGGVESEESEETFGIGDGKASSGNGSLSRRKSKKRPRVDTGDNDSHAVIGSLSPAVWLEANHGPQTSTSPVHSRSRLVSPSELEAGVEGRSRSVTVSEDEGRWR